MRRAALQRWCVGCLVGVGLVDLILWPFTTVSLATPLIYGMAKLVGSSFVMMGALHLLRPMLVREGMSARNAERMAFAEEFAFVIGVNVLFPLVITVGTYLVASVAPGPWVDPWLAWPEEAVGITQPVVRTWVERHGLLGLSDGVYGTPPAQGALLLLYCLVWRREFTPAWEFATYVTTAAVPVLVAWFFLPALSPYSHYAYPPSVTAPLFVAHMTALRSGAPFALEEATGLLTMPSFHTVFALLLAWVYRHDRLLFPVAAALNVAVVLSIVPSGWHYVADVLVGVLWTVGAVVATDQVVARMGRSR